MSEKNNDFTHNCLEDNETYSARIKYLKDAITTYDNFPKPGISFKDTFSLLRNSDTLQKLIDVFCDYIKTLEPDVIVGVEARGFTIGCAIAYKLNLPFVPVRKKGKLPGELKTVTYALEYGQDVLQIQSDSIKEGQKVVIVDDLIATGGSMNAAIDLVKSIGGLIENVVVVIELKNIGWENRVKSRVTSFFKI